MRRPSEPLLRAFALLAVLAAPAGAAAHDVPKDRRYATVVVSDRSPRTASQRTVGPAEIAASPRRRSADDLLRLVPGVLLIQHGAEGKGQQMFMRGFDAAHGADIEVKVAGVAVNELSNIHGQGYVDLGFVIPEVVRRVTANKGPFLLDQGNFANAGTIRFDLGVEPDARGSRIGYEFGSTLRHRGVFVHAPKNMAKETFFAVEAMTDKGFAAARAAQRATFLGQIRLLDSKTHGALDLTAGVYAAKFDAPGAVRADDVAAGRVDFAGVYRDDGGGRSNRLFTALRHQLDLGAGKLEQRLHGQLRALDLVEDFTGYLLDPLAGDRRNQRHRFASLGYQLDYRRPLHRTLELLAGGAWQGDVLRQHDVRVDVRHEVVSRNWDLGAGQHQAHARAGLRWRPVDRFVLEAGARLDLVAYNVRDRIDLDRRARKVLALPSPRINASVRLAPFATLFLAYGRGLRAPEARAVLGGAAVPEDTALDRYRGGPARIVASDSVEVGTRFQHRELVSAGLSLFGTWIDRELVFDHVSAVNIELNRTRRLGVDFDLAVWPRRWLQLRQDVSLVQARFVDSGAPVPLAPPFMSATGLTLVHPSGFRAGARFLVVGSRALPHGARTSAYALLDLSLGYRVGPLQLDLQIDNVTNAHWKEGEYHFASWWDRSEPRSTIPTLHFLAGPPLTARIGATLWL
ncbi:TonB-dependent receptor [Nannocystis sp. ILAH1]|uniref:TonB-dependent receptor n=1 Tax=unclassified Nannocystis TaxID=2627009 RepID=UPI002271DCE5|nr:TonB-dependent receptor [Nannocystis sp. ILAH1]MCY1063289.1 TonB-dependent receptor [Nannocystis sp. RBIL2]